MQRAISLAVVFLLCLLTPSRADPCQAEIDAIAVVDGSGSVGWGGFITLKSVLKSFVDGFIDQNQRFAVVVFSSSVAKVINFSGDKTQLKKDIDNLPYPGQGTNTHLGIERMITMMSSYGRADAVKIGMVFTDGQSNYPSATAQKAQEAKDRGIDMFALGFTGYTLSELQAIASSNDQIFTVDNVNEFMSKISTIIDKVCVVDGGWTSWTVTTIDPCSVSCGTGEGNVTRERSCTNPSPSNGGAPCPGSDTEVYTISCTMEDCPDPNQMCANCRYKNGNGYLPVPGDCFSFYQCEDNGSDYEEIECPAGTYYNPEGFVCEHCVDDQTVNGVYCNCSLNADPNITWDCRNRRAVAGDDTVYEEYRSQGGWTMMSCGSGHIYNDTSCTCQLVADSSSSSGPCSGCVLENGICYKLIDCSTFMQCSQNGAVLGTIKCAPGLHFNMNLKVCDWPRNVNCDLGTTPSPPVCKPEVYLPFNGNTNDESGNHATIANDNVDIHPLNYAMFYNNSGLGINRFTNMDFQSTLEITFTFKLGNGLYSDQAMVTNADCGLEGSIFIIQRNTTEIEFTVFDSDNTKHTLSIDLDPSLAGAHSGFAAPSTPVTLEIRDGFMTAAVGSNSLSKSFPGTIRQSPCALHIGRGTIFNNFMGHMDEFEVYIC